MPVAFTTQRGLFLSSGKHFREPVRQCGIQILHSEEMGAVIHYPVQVGFVLQKTFAPVSATLPHPHDASFACGDTDKMNSKVTPTVQALILDLLDWLSRQDRSYDETMNAWRTSCPRLPVWEDANDQGLVRIENVDGRSSVRVTTAGHDLLQKLRPDQFPPGL
jgi:hypothetical protein